MNVLILKLFQEELAQVLKYLESLNMMNKYEKWYENIDEYSKLEQYIENIFVKLLNINSINREKWIFPYFKTTYSDGTSFMDGNPIFSARAPNEKKIIKIIVDDNYDAIYDFNSSFDENLLYTVINNKFSTIRIASRSPHETSNPDVGCVRYARTRFLFK